MKRIIPLLLTLLLLCGCGSTPAIPATEVSVENTPAKSTGSYTPASEPDDTAHGPLHVFPMERTDCLGTLPMGDDLLLFAGTDLTTLIKLSGSNLYTTAETVLDCSILPDDPSVQVSEKGVTYYDELTHELVFLDTGLKEVKRFSLPEDIQGSPTLSTDRKSLYYCTADALRVLDLETGLQKLLKEMFFEQQTIVNLHCNDSVVECSVTDSSGNSSTLFFSTQTGETLWEVLSDITLTTWGDSYFAIQRDGAYPEILVGTTDIGPYTLYFDDWEADALPLPDCSAAVLISSAPDANTVTLHYFDLISGNRTAQLELKGSARPRSLHSDKGGAVWLVRYDEAYECDVICRWNPTLTPIEDGTQYLKDRYTFESPDTEGLAACQEKADEISAKYSVQIRIWADAVEESPDDCTLQPEYQVPIIRSSLETLDQVLSRYPEGFLKEAARGTSCGVIQICLVRSVSDSPEDAAGIQFWNRDEDAFICLAVSSSLEQNLHHELFHIIENRVMSTCSAYDNWSELNPKGFSYDNDYQLNLYREDYDLIQGKSRAFIDIYSMSFPKEDRARIMEFAMTEGNADCFTSPIMQSKLRQLCIGIRAAFKLQNSAEPFPWEQYLTESLTSAN